MKIYKYIFKAKRMEICTSNYMMYAAARMRIHRGENNGHISYG